jgi:hypothetical protein
MLYEQSRHGVTEPDLVKHMRKMMFDFMAETLQPAATHGQSASESTAVVKSTR